MEQIDSGQGGERRGIMMDRRGRDLSNNMYEWPMNMDNRVWVDCGSGGLAGQRRPKGENWNDSNKNSNRKKFF